VRFTLRGEHALDASMNAIVFERLPHRPMDGTLVQAYGRIAFWSRRSSLSMRVERLEPAGEGLLRARVEELRARLEREGLMDPARKRRPPMIPRRIGLVTSSDGAARDDVLTTLAARFPADVLLVGVPVQGDAAPGMIVRALRHLSARPDVDVIVVARGGGSLEDLMAFNSESVCRAVAEARVPVVSAVGHERDVTLCDLVADVRVATPTAAAAAVVPSMEALETRLADAGPALARALRTAGALRSDRVERLAPRLRAALGRAAGRAPVELEARAERMARAARTRGERAAAGVERAEGLLALLSPARTVARGYAIVRDAADGRVLGSAAAVGAGRAIELEMRDGRVPARAEVR
jgi:exodeoxyribonuclease VII large subunit